MAGKWGRVQALAGVVFAVLAFAAVALTGGAPGTDASASSVRTFYTSHSGRLNAGALVMGVAALVGLVFFTYVRSYFRSTGAERGSTLFLTGGVLLAVAFTLSAGGVTMLTDVPGKLSPASLQAMNVLQQDIYWPMLSVGTAVLYLGAAMAIFKTRALPIWLGWVAAIFVPFGMSIFLGFVPLIGSVVWMIAVGVVLARRNPDVDAGTPGVASAEQLRPVAV